MRNKYAALIMVAALCLLTFLPCYAVNAIPTMNTYTYDIAQGNISISAGANSGTINIQYFSQSGTQLVDNITTGQAITINDSNPSTPTTNYVKVEPNLGTLNITLENVNIITNSDCPFSIGSGLTVNLTLSGNNYLDAGASNYAGLGVPSGTALDITAASTGSLRSTGGSGTGGSGIGGGGGGNGGIVTVNGGTVMAYGGQGGSGIGGGDSGNGGTVTVNGGTVTAKGGPGGSGIGGGYNGSGGILTIDGGTVTATGGNGGSGIGGGGSGNGGTMTVKGGTVTAISGTSGTGIGGGYNVSGGSGSLTIDGGSVWASSQPNVYDSNHIQEYLVTISGLPSSVDVTYKVNGGNSVSCATDSSGKLYLWLPLTIDSATDDIQITCTSGGAIYEAIDSVSLSGNNLTANPVPAYTAQTFLSLGDSIAYGMSAAPGSDYTHLFYNHLLTDPAYSQLSLNNLAVSGDKSSDLLQCLLTPQYSAAVGNAKVITLSIGGDNLLSPVIASVCTAFGVNPVNNPNLMTELAAAMAANLNKDTILASLANSPTLTQALQSGVAQFGTDFPQIIATLKTLAPQAQIYVLNLYNPFNEQDPLYAVFDPFIRGINQAISTNAMAGYNVADVYTMFRTTPGAVNFNLTTIQLDPHPTTAGHAAIYQALLDAEAGQTPASYYAVSIAPLTGGAITAHPTSATSGSAINLTITPDAGMQLQAGSLKYHDGSDHSITGTSFTMPAANVIVSAVFEAIPGTSNGHEGGGGGSSGGGSAPAGGTTVTGSVINGTTVSNLTATVTTDSNGNYTVSMQAAQTLTFRQPDGTMSPLSDLTKVSYVSSTGSSVTVSAGAINFVNLAKGTDNQYKITYDLGNGQTITLGTLEITVSGKGTVSLKCTLIDPYGIITDAATGKPIAGAKVTLYYANTERNKTKGKTADTVVVLPGIDGFKPNNNQNPQTGDTKGAYGFMVFPDTDYYIAASKDGYEPYTSPTISVGQEIVHWDFKMSTPITGVKRLAGQSQVDTALAIAKANYTGTLSNVVLATADNYPDTLAGSVLAYKLNAPILLVGSSEADQAKVLDYMKVNLASSGNVYILGGTVVVSADMEGKVKADGFSQITRLGGIDRYETSVKIAEQLKVPSGTPLVLAYGENYPDALSISSIAAEMQYPILLVQKDGLSNVVKNEIAAINPSKVYLIGGEGVISSAVESQVEQITSLDKTNVVRIAGQDRYDTSLAVAQYFNLAGQSVCVATGSNFPDALAGSVYAANHNTSIILAGGSLSDQVVNYLKDKKLTGVTLFGGEAVVSKDIEQRLNQLMVK